MDMLALQIMAIAIQFPSALMYLTAITWFYIYSIGYVGLLKNYRLVLQFVPDPQQKPVVGSPCCNHLTAPHEFFVKVKNLEIGVIFEAVLNSFCYLRTEHHFVPFDSPCFDGAFE